MQNDYRRLRAPVDAALTLVRREKRKVQEAEEKRAVMRGMRGQFGNPDAKKAKGDLTEVGLPDEAVGKWRVEDFVF